MKVVILAGGRGTRLSEETHSIPKPMVAIGGRPILWHIMRHYARFGHQGLRGRLRLQGLRHQGVLRQLPDPRVRSLDRPRLRHRRGALAAPRGLAGHARRHRSVDDDGRTSRAARPLLDETFLLTYGDGLSDVALDDLLRYHRQQGALATVTAVHQPPRFGALEMNDGMVTRFREKPLISQDRINGGFFVFEPRVLDLLTGDDCVLEADPSRRSPRADSSPPTSTTASGSRWTRCATGTS